MQGLLHNNPASSTGNGHGNFATILSGKRCDFFKKLEAEGSQEGTPKSELVIESARISVK